MTAGIDHLGIGQYQLNQANMEKIIRHFVSKERCRLAVNLSVLHKLIAETLKIAVIYLGYDLWIAGIFIIIIVSATQTLGQIQDIVQLHGTVHL